MSADIRELLAAAERMVVERWRTSDHGSSDDLQTGSDQTALDRIAQIGAVLIDDGQLPMVSAVIDTLLYLFRTAGEPIEKPAQAVIRNGLRFPERLRDITVRVYTLGALATVRSTFAVVRPIVVQSREHNATHRLWLRETVTQLARGGKFEPKSLLPPVADYIAEHDVFFRRFHRNNDYVVNALCQFDFLQCVISVAVTGSLNECYPNFGAFFNARTEPIVESLIEGRAARAAVADISDTKLAEIVAKLDELAGNAFFAYAGWIHGRWQSNAIKSFLSSHMSNGR